MAERRVVAVFGYSKGPRADLDPICAERLAHARSIAEGAAAVVLSGCHEAELMEAAWSGPRAKLVLDLDARRTVTNALNAVRLARKLGADELVVVTSSWHRPRTALLLRAASDGLRVSVEGAPGRPAPLRLAREAACFLLLPLQLAWATRARRPR